MRRNTIDIFVYQYPSIYRYTFMERFSKVIIVTGSNRGLGRELVRRLALKFQDGCVYLTSRNKEAGLKATKMLETEGVHARLHDLDVTNDKSIDRFKDFLIREHGSPSIDILINNAGINLEGDKTVHIGKRAEDTIKVNYYGVLNVSKALFPLLNPGARILNMASSVARPARNQMSNEIRNKMDSSDLSLSELSQLMDDYVTYAYEKKHAEKGYCGHTYGVSKYGVIALTRILARDNKIPGVLINCCCPGWVRTDMGGERARIKLEDGVETPLYCVSLPEGSEINGKFIFNKEVFTL